MTEVQLTYTIYGFRFGSSDSVHIPAPLAGCSDTLHFLNFVIKQTVKKKQQQMKHALVQKKGMCVCICATL